MSLFSGKAGFVTGAAGGIGRASAIAFAPASPAILQDSWVLSQVL
jgi:NAD(P)-dependent dehydrogenase (short-subunit alcohol dehydrogenase family)